MAGAWLTSIESEISAILRTKWLEKDLTLLLLYLLVAVRVIMSQNYCNGTLHRKLVTSSDAV